LGPVGARKANIKPVKKIGGKTTLWDKKTAFLILRILRPRIAEKNMGNAIRILKSPATEMITASGAPSFFKNNGIIAYVV
jgi:hypothetical protein